METIQDCAPGGRWAPNPRALRRKSDVAPLFLLSQVSPAGQERHLQSIFTLSLPAWPQLGTLCHPPRLQEGSSRGRERPSPQLFAASRHWAPSLPSRWLFAVRPHHSHPHDSAASFQSTCPSLSISQVTPPPGSHHYPSPLFLTSSSKQPGTPSPHATLAHSLPGFLPQISSLKSSQDF